MAARTDGCPCGSGAALAECCGPIIGGEIAAPTAEALMRSRYTAFVQSDLDHIERTYARERREKFDQAATKETAQSMEWVGLEILGTALGGVDDQTGMVEFAARYRNDGNILIHRERSNFRREDGQWVYVDGDIAAQKNPPPTGKIGRNQPCPCGSGKKFKKCCGA